MKICFLAPANNYHIKKWCEYFVKKGHQVEVISFTKSKINGVKVHYINTGVKVTDTNLKKIKYLLKCNQIKKIINEMNPDIINAHYATSYGMVAALTVPKKFICSVWGTDIYVFPKKNFIYKSYLKFILKRAKCIFSTSNAMAIEVNKYTKKEVYITPFGVKMDLFNPNKKVHKDNEEFIVGTAKPLEVKYGINYIIEAISIINKKRPDINLKLKIAGQGSKEEEYKKLAIEKKINVEWLGFISQEKVAYELANMNVAIFPSINDSESFGVAVIEAQACGIPVIVSNTSGLKETTIPNETSIIVEKEDTLNLANAIIELYDNPEKRKQMGVNGRKYVLNKYEYNNCFNNIEKQFYKIKNKD